MAHPLEMGRFLPSPMTAIGCPPSDEPSDHEDDVYLVDLTAAEIKQITTDGVSAL